MPEPHYLPADVPRCWGALNEDDPGKVWRDDCTGCLRRLAPPWPLPGRTQWVGAQPQPCENYLPADHH